jgi:putative membrane protein
MPALMQALAQRNKRKNVATCPTASNDDERIAELIVEIHFVSGRQIALRNLRGLYSRVACFLSRVSYRLPTRIPQFLQYPGKLSDSGIDSMSLYWILRASCSGAGWGRVLIALCAGLIHLMLSCIAIQGRTMLSHTFHSTGLSLPVIVIGRCAIFNRILGIAAIGLLLGATQVCAESISKRDQSFIKRAVETSHAGIQVSRLALAKTRDPDVRLLATRMLDEYTRMGAHLQELMLAKEVSAPAHAGILDRSKFYVLAKLSGAMFDRQFIRMGAIAAHQDALILFSSAIVGASDHDVKAFASKTLSNLQYHLNLAVALKARRDAGN